MKNILTNLISRITMKVVDYNFTDSLSGREVFNYKDKYGNKYMANYPFYFWSFRVKK